MSDRDSARVVNRVIVPNLKSSTSGLAFTWDHRFQRLEVSARCDHATDFMQTYGLQMQPLLKAMDVRSEELRALAEELETDKNMDNISMPDLCLKAIDTLDLKGKHVLDIGSYDGKTAGYALEKGAASAAVMDNEQWRHYGWPEPVMPKGVEYIKSDFRQAARVRWDSDTQSWRSWDVVFFFNVLYHLEDPHHALRVLHGMAREEMLLCTLYVYSDLPVWRVYEPRELNPTDETVFWGPSPSGLLKSLRITGWTDVQELGRSVERIVLRCKPGR